MSAGRHRSAVELPALIAASALAGWAANRIHVPLAWMVAPLVVSCIATIAFGLPRLPIRVRYVGQVIVGAAVGLYLTPEALARIGDFAVPILLGAAGITLAACLIALAQIKLWGIDPATAVFSSVPGGPVDMAMMADQNGGDPARTALAQTLRIAMVVLLFPPILLGLAGDAAPRLVEYGTWPESALIVLVAGTAGVAARSLGFINPYFLGPMLVVGAVTALDVDLSHFHEGVVPAAQVLMGVSLGGMFQRDILVGSGRFLLSLVLTSLVLLAVSGLVAELVARLFSADLATMMLANAPGAVPEMVITAQVLHLDVPLVASFQFVRIVLSLSMAALFFRLYRMAELRLAARRAGSGQDLDE